MYKFTYRVICGVLALLFFNNFAFGIESEYKNALMKIELIKTADGAYSVDLYTKNSFSQPVKVIKKSDLNYYILLPETKNETVKALAQGTEIRSVSTNVYPYAGQDVNNGYVKININTTKPIDFRVNVKNPSAAASISPKSAQIVLDDEQKSLEPKLKPQIQKKNLESSISQKAELVKKAVKEKLPARFVQKEAQKEIQKPIYEPVKIEDVIKQEVQKAREEKLQEFEAEMADIAQEEINEAQNEEILFDDEINQIQRIAGEDKGLFNRFANKSAQFGIRFSDLLLVFAIFALGILFMLVFLKRKNNIKTSIKSKAELMGSSCSSDFKSDNEENKNNGQYFVFDKNIKQTGFCDPATSAVKRNYELSSYEPELKNKYDRNASLKKNESEYDIIQKILKEDSFIDIPSATFAQQVKVDKLDKKEDIKETKEEVKEETKEEIKPQKRPQIQTQSEPDVLSSVEIAPKRGFMLVSYNENINLMGYIFDDVFALYNFKVPKLENYDIKYRLSEKDDKIARFIVKIGNTKMLVAVSKSKMSLEVLL